MAEMAHPRVKYQKGRTINLGNFESLRVDIGIEIDCLAGQEDLAIDRCREWVDSQLRKEKNNG